MPHSDQPPATTSVLTAAVSTEVVAKARRRFFSAAEKLRIVEAADKLGRGELGALLRREGLYSSLLTDWRRLRAAGQLAADAPVKRGPRPNPQAAELKRQQQEIARLQNRLRQAEAILDAQKKMAELFALGQPIAPDEQP
jgi:transposase